MAKLPLVHVPTILPDGQWDDGPLTKGNKHLIGKMCTVKEFKLDTSYHDQ